MQYISIEEVVSSAQVSIGLDHDEYRPMFRQWAYDAQRSIGLTFLDQEIEVGDIKDLEFKKPCGYVAPIRIELMDGNDCIIPRYNASLDKCNCCDNTCSTCVIEIGENKTHFYISSDGARYGKYKIKYWKLPVDDDNQPLIPENNLRAVVAYIEYMWLKRERNRDLRRYTLSDVQYAKQEWRNLKGQAVGNQNMPHKLVFEEAMRKWNNFIVTAYKV